MWVFYFSVGIPPCSPFPFNNQNSYQKKKKKVGIEVNHGNEWHSFFREGGFASSEICSVLALLNSVFASRLDSLMAHGMMITCLCHDRMTPGSTL